MGQIHPRVKDLNFILSQTYVSSIKVCESVGRRVKPAVRPKKFATQINTRDLIKIQMNIGELSNVLSH